MKIIQCEMCGGNQLIKEDGFYTCQSCGTKYSTEEARKLTIEGKIDISGSVIKIDNSDKIENLKILARRAREHDDYDTIRKYHEMLLLEEPDDWETTFYILYYKIKYKDFPNMNTTINSVKSSLPMVVKLVEKKVEPDKQKEVLLELLERILKMVQALTMRVSKEYYDSVYGASSDLKTVFREDAKVQLDDIRSFLEVFGKMIEEIMPDHIDIAIASWDYGFKMVDQLYEFATDAMKRSARNDFVTLIRKYDETYMQEHTPEPISVKANVKNNLTWLRVLAGVGAFVVICSLLVLLSFIFR